MRKLTTNEVVQKFKEVHGTTYDYSNVKYEGTHKKVPIKCLKHFGYNIKYIWENDWKKFERGIDINPKIQTL